MGSNAALRWRTMRNLMKAQRAIDISGHHPAATSGNDQFLLLLKLVGSAFIPYQVQTDHAVTLPVKDGSIVSIPFHLCGRVLNKFIVATCIIFLQFIRIIICNDNISMLVKVRGQFFVNNPYRRLLSTPQFSLWLLVYPSIFLIFDVTFIII